MSGAWPAFWHLITWACVAWYALLTLYVAWRGISDIRGMLGRLEGGQPGGRDASSTSPASAWRSGSKPRA